MQYTENEQRAMLGKFWRQYGRFLLTAVILGLAIGYTWRHYQTQRHQSAIAASTLYQQVMHQPLQQHLGVAAPAVLAAYELVKRKSNSTYTAMTYLWLGKNAALGGKWSQANKFFQQVIAHQADKTIKQIARLRAARILLQQKKYLAAMHTLATVNDKNYLAQVKLERGDIYAAQKKWQKAMQNYQQAQASFSRMQIQAPLLGQKIAAIKLQQNRLTTKKK